MNDFSPSAQDATDTGRMEAPSGAAPSAAAQPGEDFLARVRRAAMTVLGDSPAGREVLELCEEHAEARRMVMEDRSSGRVVVAVVGATGQGKSWLMQQMVHDLSVRAAIRSGNNSEEATEKIFWVGPSPPADLDAVHEHYLHCKAADMQDIGASYMLVDAPGSTDDRGAVAAVASRALQLASILLLVVRRDQIRSEAVGMLTQASEGTIVIPVINAVRKQDDELQADMDSLAARMRKLAPKSVIAAPVVIGDFEVEGRDEAGVGREAAEKVGDRLQAELGSSWEGDRRRSTRLSALDARFRAALHSVLSDQLPGLTAAVRRLNDEARALPGEIAESLVGSGGPLRAAIRSRLRLSLLTDTAAIWFPYRSVLALLNLTHGAWDRVLMSLSGSLPSLVSAVWTSGRNVAADRNAQQDVRDGLRRRSAAAVADRLGPLAMRFREELEQMRHGRQRDLVIEGNTRSQVAYLSGLDTLQERSQRIFDDEVNRVAISRAKALLFGLVGTLIFWLLMAGPIVALYRGYFDASFVTLSELAGDLDTFPRPDFSMLLTSLLLSLLPMAIFAMIVLTISQSRGRVVRAEQNIRQQHHDAIHHLQNEGVLQLQWDEPLLADAEFLLSVGALESEAS